MPAIRADTAASRVMGCSERARTRGYRGNLMMEPCRRPVGRRDMAATDHTVDEKRQQVERLRASVERPRAVAAADRASRQNDEAVQTLEPRVSNMQEAVAALTTVVNLSGAVQRELVGSFSQLEPGDLDSSSSPDQSPGPSGERDSDEP